MTSRSTGSGSARSTGFINAQIRAKVQGYLLKKAYQEGALVKEGDVLFQLDPRQYEAALAVAKANLSQSARRS